MFRELELVRELGDAIHAIRRLYAEAGLPLPPGSGIGRLVAEVEELLASAADGKIAANPENIARVRYLVLLRDAATALGICERHSVPLRSHLAQLRTGDIDLGVRGRAGERAHFKDFHYELFLLALLLHHGIQAVFTESGAPEGDIELKDGLLIEAKHPTSSQKLAKYAREFNAELAARNRFGLFAIAVEDAFGFGQRQQFADDEDHAGWMASRHAAIDQFWTTKFLEDIAGCGRILGCLQTTRHIPMIAGGIRLHQNALGMVFARPGAPPEFLEQARAVSAAVTPDVRIIPPALHYAEIGMPARQPAFALSNTSWELKPGTRLGAYQGGTDGNALAAVIWECRRSVGGRSIIELVQVVGVLGRVEDLDSLHRQLMKGLKAKGEPFSLVYDDGADLWFSRNGIPKPTDPAADIGA